MLAFTLPFKKNDSQLTGSCYAALYDDRSVRSHVRRIRDLVSTPSLHSSLSTTFAMEYEANQHTPGGMLYIYASYLQTGIFHGFSLVSPLCYQ